MWKYLHLQAWPGFQSHPTHILKSMMTQAKERRIQGARGYDERPMHLFQVTSFRHCLSMFDTICIMFRSKCMVKMHSQVWQVLHVTMGRPYAWATSELRYHCNMDRTNGHNPVSTIKPIPGVTKSIGMHMDFPWESHGV